MPPWAAHFIKPPALPGDRLLRGEAYDGRTDLFSVGCILYELVTGQKAFGGESLTALLLKITNEEPEIGLIPIGRDWQRLRGVIGHALQKKPEDRYPDARAMRADLELAIKELGQSGDWTPPPSGSPAPRLH